MTSARSDVIADYRRALYGVTAPRLAGREVVLEWRKPYVKEFLGLCAKGPKGAAVIQIAPDLDEPRTFEVFLHECAHARVHFDQLPDHANHEKPPASYKLIDRQEFNEETQPRENEAEKLVAHWQSYCGGVESISGKLSKLLSWKPKAQ